MLATEDSDDPLGDPFACIADDPLVTSSVNNSCHSSEDENSSEFYDSETPNHTPFENIKVHRIQAYQNNTPTIKKPYNNTSISYVNDKTPETFGNKFTSFIKNNLLNGNNTSLTITPIINGSVTESDEPTPKRRGRKKGSKNKFKKGIPIDLLSDQLKGYAIETPVDRVKRKYTKRQKPSDDEEQTEDSLDALEASYTDLQYTPPPPTKGLVPLVVELDPAQFYPDEPHRERRNNKLARMKQAKWDALPYHCDICRKGFKIVKGLQAHKSLKHGVEDLAGCYPCECCVEVFYLKRHLTLHLVERHQDKQGRLPCPEQGCYATEPDVQRLARHKSRCHPYLGTLGRNWFHTWGDR